MWFSGLLACPDLCCDNTTNILKSFQVFSFDSLTVISKYVQISTYQKGMHFLPDSFEPLSRRPRGVRNEEDLFSPLGLFKSL